MSYINMKNIMLQKILVAIPLVVISLLIFFWSQVAPSLPLTKEQLLGLGLSALFAAFIYFDSRISEIISQPKEMIVNGSFGKCFQVVASKMRYVKHLRIYGNSTKAVQPTIQESNITFGKCEILIRDGNKRNKKFKNHIDEKITEWEIFKQTKNIELEIKKYDFIPTEWYLIFDNEFIIYGLSLPKKDRWNEIEAFTEMTLIQNRSIETGALIEKYIRRFDEFFKDMPEVDSTEKL